MTSKTSLEGISANFGPVVARVNALKAERTRVISDLREIVTTAENMLADLGEAAPGAGSATRRSRLSPEGRARIVAAAKRRWARHRKAQRGS